jgi:putative transposase
MADTLNPIPEELIEQLFKQCKDPKELLGGEGLLAQLKKRLLERALAAEMDEHLGYERHAVQGRGSGNSRNGKGRKRILADGDQIEIETPRDRNGSFEPQLIPKRQRRFSGFNDKILALYAHGQSVRDIQSALEEMYGVEVSEGLISAVTDAVVEEVRQWQSRPLDPVYPIVFLDCIMVKSREEGRVQNRAVYLALGVNMEGNKELLGLWIAKSEGAKFWLGVITELRNRGVAEIFIACVDGLKGFPEAIEAVFPQTEIQLCIVHMIRNSVRYVPWKDRKAMCADLKSIYGADTADQAAEALERLAEQWDGRYPTVSQLWRNHWDRVTPFFAFPKDIRRAIYTTNAIESLNRSLRKTLKTKGAFPNDESILKVMYLALERISKKWTMPIRNWPAALNQFAIRYEGRFPL